MREHSIPDCALTQPGGPASPQAECLQGPELGQGHPRVLASFTAKMENRPPPTCQRFPAPLCCLSSISSCDCHRPKEPAFLHSVSVRVLSACSRGYPLAPRAVYLSLSATSPLRALPSSSGPAQGSPRLCVSPVGSLPGTSVRSG